MRGYVYVYVLYIILFPRFSGAPAWIYSLPTTQTRRSSSASMWCQPTLASRWQQCNLPQPSSASLSSTQERSLLCSLTHTSRECVWPRWSLGGKCRFYLYESLLMKTNKIQSNPHFNCMCVTPTGVSDSMEWKASYCVRAFRDSSTQYRYNTDPKLTLQTITSETLCYLTSSLSLLSPPPLLPIFQERFLVTPMQ